MEQSRKQVNLRKRRLEALELLGRSEGSIDRGLRHHRFVKLAMVVSQPGGVWMLRIKVMC